MYWPPKNNVLVPIDFSEQSLKALDTALAIAGAPPRVHVIHVLLDLPAGEPGMMFTSLDQAARAKASETGLREFLQGDSRRAEVTREIAFGDPGEEIAAYAERIGADLIVMPSHGRRGISRILIGSVAERVLRLSHCPVLVLRGLSKSG